MDILGAVGVSVQLAQAAYACLKTIHNIRQVGQLSREQNDAHLNLLIQAMRFEKWCYALGIQDNVEETGSSERSPGGGPQDAQLKETIKSRLRLNNPQLVELIRVALGDMKDKFAEATNVISRYAAKPEPPPNTDTLQVPKGKLSSTWNKFKRKSSSPASSSNQGLVSESQSSVVSRTRWVTSDKDTVNDMLKSISKTNDLLLVLLEPVLQAQVDRQTNMTILDNFDHTTLVGTENLPDNSDLRALAKIKQWQSREKWESQGQDAVSGSSFSTTSANSSYGRVHSYQIQDFGHGALPHGDYRTLAKLEGNQVLVEWKYYNKDQPIRLEQTLRLGGLVGLLNRNSLFKKFSTLPCRGLVNDTENSRIGIVFSTEGSTTRVLESLQNFIRVKTTPIPVGQRFELAKELVTAVHHLHSVEWLHKSIRSDNIICFQEQIKEANSKPKPASNGPRSNEEDDHGAESTASLSAPLAAAPPTLPKFYLVGWDLSRPDHPAELSETLSISTAGFQSKRDAILLYSHPSMHAPSGVDKRPRYRPQFDIYSLGLVLLEIGLWRTLDMIKLRCRSDAEFRLRIRTEYCDKLLPKMGEVYWRVVQRCLNNDFGYDSRVDAEQGDFSLQVAFERHVVCELERCFA